MYQVDTARVDMGPAHNGRVERRNVFAKDDGTLVIVVKGKHIPVICIVQPKLRKNYVAYVTKGW